jgi:small basic protein
MFLLLLLALIIGFCMFYIPGNGLAYSETFTRYTAVAIVAGMDTLIGGFRAWLTDSFDSAIFTSGFIVNIFLAIGLVGLGEYMGLETGFGDSRISVMMIAAVVVFSARILNNLTTLRRLMIERWRARQSAQTESANVVDSSAQSLERVK